MRIVSPTDAEMLGVTENSYKVVAPTYFKTDDTANEACP
jgi:hypothetical protein